MLPPEAALMRALHVIIIGSILMSIFGAVGRLEAQQDLVHVYGERNADDGYDFYADSSHIIETFVTVDFRRLVNLDAEVEFPYSRTIGPGERRVHLFTLDLEDPTKRRGYSVAYSFARGDPDEAAHDDSFPYLFPFAHGSKYRITQGYGGEFTHYGENEYAVDFDMEIGTPVHAARGGLVVEVKEDSRVGGPAARYGEHGNYILIAHDDGSFAHYVHLRPNGSIVDVGDRVAAGDHIGYSGNTGRSAGPHLHFDVRVPREDGTMQSIPTVFRGHNGGGVSPEEGRYYYARHPGGEPFETVFGRDLRHAEFESHSVEVPRNSQVAFRTERVDSTYIAYVRNGYGRAVDVVLTVSGRGVEATAELPRSMRIPPGTERFFTLVRPKPGARELRYSLRVLEATLAAE
jgi:murein DD-endopeptidase MepM/ murein hydrolase activator NlpD